MSTSAVGPLFVPFLLDADLLQKLIDARRSKSAVELFFLHLWSECGVALLAEPRLKAELHKLGTPTRAFVTRPDETAPGVSLSDWLNSPFSKARVAVAGTLTGDQVRDLLKPAINANKCAVVIDRYVASQWRNEKRLSAGWEGLRALLTDLGDAGATTVRLAFPCGCACRACGRSTGDGTSESHWMGLEDSRQTLTQIVRELKAPDTLCVEWWPNCPHRFQAIVHDRFVAFGHPENGDGLLKPPQFAVTLGKGVQALREGPDQRQSMIARIVPEDFRALFCQVWKNLDVDNPNSVGAKGPIQVWPPT